MGTFDKIWNEYNEYHPKTFLKQCNQCFYHFKDFLNDFKLFENYSFKTFFNKPLRGSIMQHLF
jgi:hypothetical protein